VIESKSKVRGGPPSVLPAAPGGPWGRVVLSEDLELTVRMGDRVAGAVGASHSAVGDSATLPDSYFLGYWHD